MLELRSAVGHQLTSRGPRGLGPQPRQRLLLVGGLQPALTRLRHLLRGRIHLLFAVGEHFPFLEAGEEPDGLSALAEACVVFVDEGQLAHYFAQAFSPDMVPVACAFAPRT